MSNSFLSTFGIFFSNFSQPLQVHSPKVYESPQGMAIPLSTFLSFPSSPPSPPFLHPQKPKITAFPTHLPIPFKPSTFSLNPRPKTPKKMLTTPLAAATDLSLVQQAIKLVHSSPPTWQSSLLSNLLIFILGSPILVSGLSLSGIAAAFLLVTLTWRAFGPSGSFLVASYFVIVSQNQLLFEIS